MSSLVKDDELIYRLEENFRKVCYKIKLKGREILNDFDITPPQFQALLLINKNGALTIGELSNQMYLACSTVTDLLDRMERNDLVMRVKDEKDRRIVRIKMLEKGDVLIAGVMENRRNYIREIVGDLDEELLGSIDQSFILLNDKVKF